MLDLGFLHISAFYELSFLLVLAAAVGFLGLLLRQPMIVSFIATGVIAGPSVLGIAQSQEHVQLLAELGIAVLLFLVGLKLDIKLIKTLGTVSLATGLGQVLFTSSIGFFIGIALGMDALTAFYIAVALTFSSTIIIVKLLSDKKEVDTLHGKIAIGFLIVQDLVVVLAMIVLSAIGIGAGQESLNGENNVVFQILEVLAYGLAMLVFIAVFMRTTALPLLGKMARSPELMITFAIAWAALLASLGGYLGFSKELGGLLAGISLASTPYREIIIARLSSLRDFLLLFFFIALGAQLDLNLLGAQVMPAVVFSLFVLIGNPLIVLIIMGYMGYRKRTGFLAGLTVAQISEFSLIFVAMGMTIGHVNNEALGLVTLVGLVTIALSVYMITYSHTLYRWLEPVLGVFERKVPYNEEIANRNNIGKKSFDMIVFGQGRYGSELTGMLRKEGHKLLAVDFNPDIVRECRSKGYDTMYGDACDQEFLGLLPLENAKWVIAAMPQHETGLTHEDPRIVLAKGLRSHNYKGKIAVSTQYKSDIKTFKEKGVDVVFLPYKDAASLAVKRIKEEGEEASQKTIEKKKAPRKKRAVKKSS